MRPRLAQAQRFHDYFLFIFPEHSLFGMLLWVTEHTRSNLAAFLFLCANPARSDVSAADALLERVPRL